MCVHRHNLPLSAEEAPREGHGIGGGAAAAVG